MRRDFCGEVAKFQRGPSPILYRTGLLSHVSIEAASGNLHVGLRRRTNQIFPETSREWSGPS
jgi:hypothetical protein